MRPIHHQPIARIHVLSRHSTCSCFVLCVLLRWEHCVCNLVNGRPILTAHFLNFPRIILLGPNCGRIKVKFRSIKVSILKRFRLKTYLAFITCVQISKPSTLLRFRLLFTLKRSKALIVFIDNAYIRKLSPDWRHIWKRSPIVFLWTEKTEAFENANVIHIT